MSSRTLSSDTGTQSLGSKHRPQLFEEVVGQRHAVQGILAMVRSDQPRHLLLTGASGLGKTTLGRQYAKALNCSSALTLRPCGTCPSCRQMDDGYHEAFHELNGAGSECGKESLIEFFDEVLSLRPFSHFCHVVFIDEAHRLSAFARDFLLKRLEDGGTTIFIFAAIDPDQFPVQLKDRCRPIGLLRPSAGDAILFAGRICDGEGVEIHADALQLIAARATNYRKIAEDIERVILAAGGLPITVILVRDTLIRTQTLATISYLQALGERDLKAQLRWLSEIPLDPLQKHRAVLDAMRHLQLTLVGPSLLPADREAELRYDRDVCSQIVAGLHDIAAKGGMPLTALFDQILEFWMFMPLAIDAEIITMQAVRLHNLLTGIACPAIGTSPRTAGAADEGFRSTRGLRVPVVRLRLTSLNADHAGAYLSFDQARRIYDASSFLIQEYGVTFNAQLIIIFAAIGLDEEHAAAKVLSEVAREFAQRVADWNGPRGGLYRISSLSRGSAGLEGRIILHLPPPLSDKASLWFDDFFSRLSRADGHAGDGHVFHPPLAADRRRQVHIHWQLVQHLWAGLDPHLHIDGVPLIEHLGVSTSRRYPAGVIDSRRHHFSQNIGRKSQQAAAQEGMRHLSALDHGAWDQVLRGWEFREHEERSDERVRRGRVMQSLADQMAATGDPLTRTALQRAMDHERASWMVEPGDRPRSRQNWASRKTPAPIHYEGEHHD